MDVKSSTAGSQPRTEDTKAADAAPTALSIEQVLAWADAYHAAHGRWPEAGPAGQSRFEPVSGVPGESWQGINHALALGLRGLPGDSSLAELLAEQRGVPLPDMGPRALAQKIWNWEQEQFPVKGPKRRKAARCNLPPLTVAKILAWADAHHAAHGRWPTLESGVVEASPGEDWSRIDYALEVGSRGLPGGSSLSRQIREHRGLPVLTAPTRLTLEQVLSWMKEYRAATGRWPSVESGPVPGAPEGLTWKAINQIAMRGHRGLPKGMSLAQLRHEHLEPRPHRPELRVAQILAWADAHHARWGRWPHARSGRIEGTACETWTIIAQRLDEGGRGLPGGQNLTLLLMEHRGFRSQFYRPRLSMEQILAWADAHHAVHGTWPGSTSGPIEGSDGDTWGAVNIALAMGGRGLPGGSTLVQLLAEHRGGPRPVRRDKLTAETILAWADAHHEATGEWPKRESGAIPGSPGNTWEQVYNGLYSKKGGLSSTLRVPKLLAEHRQVRRVSGLPPLTTVQILAWADAHQAVHGRWPTNKSGAISGTLGETWRTIDSALRLGHRGLSAGGSLSKFLAAHRPTRTSLLSMEIIQDWAAAHEAATGRPPTARSGPVLGVPGETWCNINHALRFGRRGLAAGQSVAKVCPAPVNRLTVEMIRNWVLRHHETTGQWPHTRSGAIEGTPAERWPTIDDALRAGRRGLPGGSNLGGFIRRYVDPAASNKPPDLTEEQILTWADSHKAATGRWPTADSGQVAAAPRETWKNLDCNLRRGLRGLPPGSSVSKLIRRYRGGASHPAPGAGREEF
jgi:hypothetical protein